MSTTQNKTLMMNEFEFKHTRGLGRPLPYLKEAMGVKYQIIVENSQTDYFMSAKV